MIRRLLKTIAICIASLLGLLVAAYGLLVLLSLQKAPLHPEVEAFLRPEAIVVAPERNGFYFWIGLNAPAGEDPIQYGKRAIAELGHRSPAAKDAAAARAEKELRLVYDRKLICNQVPCLYSAMQNAAQLRELAKANAELLRRYAALIRFDEFATDMPVLDPMDLLPAREDQLFLFRLARTLDAVDVNEGKAAEAIDRLATRVRFLRLMHANSAGLIDRIIAQALLAKDLEFLVKMAVSEPGAAKAVTARVAAIAAPMTVAERSPLKWMRHEFSNKFASTDPGKPDAWRQSVCGALLGKFGFDSYIELSTSGKLDERCGRWDMRILALAGAPLIDRNAMANQRFETIRQLHQIDAPDTLSYLGRFHAVVAAAEGRRRADTSWPLRNPVDAWIGTALIPDSVADAKSYHLSAIDLDRLFALTRLAVALNRDRIKESEIAAYLKQPGVLDPATKEPFGWDSAKGQVFFVPLDPWIAARGRVGGIDGRVGLTLVSALR
ncbi:MAG: hypothetical protein Q7S17_06700 [Xanthobacteraceae bacterium]|nr:hypothetical protein [Xanthobacteraceae bacterium]